MKERLDDIGFGGYKLLQDPNQFCYGIDAVLLADFANAKVQDSIVDLGTGTGVIPLILHYKSGAKKIVGIEKQVGSYNLAIQNAKLNNLTDKIDFKCMDVIDVRDHFKAGEFSLVVTNPPYTEKGRGPNSPFNERQVARHETTAGINDFVEAASYLLSPLGNFYIVHRPSRLIDILYCCRQNKLEPKRIKFVAPKQEESPNIVLVQCVKNGGKELIVEPMLFVRYPNGEYTKEINKIYERSTK